jgi:hypothetical protein
MKKALLIIMAIFLFAALSAQSSNVTNTGVIRKTENASTMADQSELKIFPVPVKENNFTITSVREFRQIRITNIIGQEILREEYPTPLLSVQVILNSPQRGVYLVAVLFPDNSRVVKRIMIEP